MIRFLLAMVVAGLVVQAATTIEPAPDSSDKAFSTTPPSSEKSTFDINKSSPAENAPSLQHKHDEDGVSDEFLVAAGILLVASAAAIGALMFVLSPRRTRRHSRRRRVVN